MITSLRHHDPHEYGTGALREQREVAAGSRRPPARALRDRERRLRSRIRAGVANVCDDVVVSHVVFRSLEVEDFSILVEWFAEPAVALWWNEPAELASVESKYQPRVEGREPTSMWIVEIDGFPGGLFQCYRHVDYPEHDACVDIGDAVGIDYLLGDAHRGRGLGTQVLGAFAAHALDQHPTSTVCVATPAQENTASWRALERAGFTRHGECQPPDEPAAFIYAISRSELDEVEQSRRR